MASASTATSPRLLQRPADRSYGTAPERPAGPSKALTPGIRPSKSDQLSPPPKAQK
jgi:hypothetical protein